MNKLTTILLNSLLLTFSWQQNESTQPPYITQLQVLEYNIMEDDHRRLGIDPEKDLVLVSIASKDSNQLLGGVILKSDQEHNSSTIYENFIFTDGQQLDKKSHYMAHRLGYQLIQPYNAPPVHTLLQWLAQNPEKKIHALAFNHPICSAWHYLLTIIYPEGKIQLDRQVCNPQSLRPLNPLIMRYLDEKIMQSKKPLQVTRNILDLFFASHNKRLMLLEVEKYILQNELRKASKALTYVPTQIIHEHTDWVLGVTFSPDGKRLATCSWQGRIRIYNATTYELVKELKEHRSFLKDITFSPDGKYFALIQEFERVYIYDAKTYQLLKRVEDTKWFNSITFSRNGKLLAVACANDIHIYDVTTYELLKKIEDHTDEVNSVTFSPDGKLLVSGSDDNTIHIYDATTYQLLKRIKKPVRAITGLAFSFNNNHLVCILECKSVHVYHLHTYKRIKKLPIDFEENRVDSIAFSPSNQFLAVSSGSGNIYLYNATNYELFKILKGHTDIVYSLVFSPNGTYLASGSEDKSVRIWESINFSEIN